MSGHLFSTENGVGVSDIQWAVVNMGERRGYFKSREMINMSSTLFFCKRMEDTVSGYKKVEP